MPIIPTQTDYELAQLRVRNIKTKIEVLNFSFQTIDSLEGIVTSGSISVDANSDIRRTCSLTLTIEKGGSTLIQPGGNIWLDKYIRIYQGIDNPRDNYSTVWWNMGLFLINSPNSSYAADTHSITFEGLDLMAKISDKRGGQLPAVTTVIPTGSNLADVVKQIITQLGGFNQYIIEDDGLTIPYDIKKDMGSTIYELLVEIRDLYAEWEMFFDTDGIFHWQKIPSGKTEPILIDFNQLNQQIIISDDLNIDFENVKNNIIVYGRLLDNGHQVVASATDQFATSPFNTNIIGQINYIINDEKIYSDDLAGQRARYELYIHSRMNDSITLNIVPIYWLNDVNIKIHYNNTDLNIEGEYLIKSLSIPLEVGGTMQVTAIKLYDEEVVLNTAITEYLRCGNNYTSSQTQFPYIPLI